MSVYSGKFDLCDFIMGTAGWYDKDGNPVDDIDSKPGEWNDGEDDQDEEHVKVEYFDLSLLKFVSKVIVIEDGKETITETEFERIFK